MAHATRAGVLRRALDRIYTASAALAATCLVAMLGVIVVQMIARWSAFTFPGATDYAGYLMAAASFLAFAGALNSDAHIRVGLFLNALGEAAVLGRTLVPAGRHGGNPLPLMVRGATGLLVVEAE